jgi:bifunctional oligoribonuclease and PAP phosphatase NrnA
VIYAFSLKGCHTLYFSKELLFMVDAKKFQNELESLHKALTESKRILITAPGNADGDSIGTQLALRRMLLARHPHVEVRIINDEQLPERYLFMPDIQHVETPESYATKSSNLQFDVGFIVDGGIDRAGRVKEVYERCKVKVFIDHHTVSVDYPYTIKMVEPTASSTTELLYALSVTPFFNTPLDIDFSQQIYLGLIFDTGFFRHSNTTPEVMELAAKLLRTGFDFTRVGERGMLERSFSSLQLLSYTLSRAQLRANGKVIWSTLTQQTLRAFHATDDDREGIIDHLFLTTGIEVALLFFELPHNKTKVSLRSQGLIDVAKFARSLTERGGGHKKAAGANLDWGIDEAVETVLGRLEPLLTPGANYARM